MHRHSLSTYSTFSQDFEDDELFDDYDNEETDSDSELSDEGEGVGFEELKHVINNQFKKTHRNDLFLLASILPEQYTIDPKESCEAKKNVKSNPTCFATNPKNTLQKFNYNFFNKKDFYNHLIANEIKEEEQRQQKIMQKRLNEILNNLTKIGKSFKKIAALNKAMEKLHVDTIEEQQKKEFVDYILLEMAGINNKKSAAYQNLSKLPYITLLFQMNKFLRKHPIKHYKHFENLQNDFIKHLYRRVLKIKELPFDIFSDIYILPEQIEELEQKPSEAKPLPLHREKMPEVEKSPGILDRINQILHCILSYLNYIFCCQAIPTQQEALRFR